MSCGSALATLVGVAALAAALTGCEPLSDDDGDESSASAVRLKPSPASVAAAGRKVKPVAIPRSIGPRQRFRIQFTSRAQLGVYEGRRRSYLVFMRGPSKIACLQNPYGQRDHGRRGERIAIVLDPRTFKGGRLCRGRYRGRVAYSDGRACPAEGVCELPSGFGRLQRPVGRFTVHVR